MQSLTCSCPQLKAHPSCQGDNLVSWSSLTFFFKTTQPDSQKHTKRSKFSFFSMISVALQYATFSGIIFGFLLTLHFNIALCVFCHHLFQACSVMHVRHFSGKWYLQNMSISCYCKLVIICHWWTVVLFS